jgi:hypothetical protein
MFYSGSSEFSYAEKDRFFTICFRVIRQSPALFVENWLGCGDFWVTALDFISATSSLDSVFDFLKALEAMLKRFGRDFGNEVESEATVECLAELVNHGDPRISSMAEDILGQYYTDTSMSFDDAGFQIQ